MTQHVLIKNNLQLTIRHAGPDDAEAILTFIEQMAGESENTTFGPGEFGLSVEEERRTLQQYAETANCLYIVAEIAGEIVGTLSFEGGKRPRLRHSGDFGISVLRKYWNFGIGKYLLSYLIDWARQTGMIRKINLHVRVDNLPAIHLYEKYGFVHEGRITRRIYLHEQFFDVYAMGLQLDPLPVTSIEDEKL